MYLMCLMSLLSPFSTLICPVEAAVFPENTFSTFIGSLPVTVSGATSGKCRGHLADSDTSQEHEKVVKR